MLHYEWGNPSTMMLSGEEPEPALNSDPANHLVEHYATGQPGFIEHNNNLVCPTQQATATVATPFSHHFNSHFNSLYDPHSYSSACHYAPHPLLSLDPLAGGGNGSEFLLVPKSEEVSRPPPVDFASRIGLNLGGRTYFSSSEDDFVNRLYRRSRTGDPGSSNSPRCQAEGCNADLTHAKHYHRRHKVCEFHSKASTVITAGLTQRFCQQCSRFHLLAEFDNGKRSCRKRLADHNRRRRKTQQSNHGSPKSQLPETTSLIDTTARSPVDSGAQSSWSVTVAVSPPRMSLDCFHQRSYHASALSSSSNPLFFSSG